MHYVYRIHNTVSIATSKWSYIGIFPHDKFVDALIQVDRGRNSFAETCRDFLHVENEFYDSAFLAENVLRRARVKYIRPLPCPHERVPGVLCSNGTQLLLFVIVRSSGQY